MSPIRFRGQSGLPTAHSFAGGVRSVQGIARSRSAPSSSGSSPTPRAARDARTRRGIGWFWPPLDPRIAPRDLRQMRSRPGSRRLPSAARQMRSRPGSRRLPSAARQMRSRPGSRRLPSAARQMRSRPGSRRLPSAARQMRSRPGSRRLPSAARHERAVVLGRPKPKATLAHRGYLFH